VKSEDLVQFGFESEFVGRLPVRSVFERLTEADLCDILKNPNNPIILGKNWILPPMASMSNSRPTPWRCWRIGHMMKTPVRADWSVRWRAPCCHLKRRCPLPPIARFAVTRPVIEQPDNMPGRAARPTRERNVQAGL
jgi:hypothetical protein